MAGIYIHIPFCKKICYYCDFYKSANYRYVDDFIVALLKEIASKKDFTKKNIETIYFGGGTPSSISLLQINQIISKINTHFKISDSAEITFEINPDDVDLSYLSSLRKLGVNRLSIGIQSFNDKILKYLNRRHNAKQAIDVISDAKTAGFTNISIDLIYGIPNQSISDFMHDLNLFSSFNLNHLSAYHLTIENNTHFGRMLKKGIINEIHEKQSLLFYNELTGFMNINNYEHYEISSFALNGFYSKHNTSYWKNVSYIGVGPSAHSFDGNYRYWNVSSVKDYVANIKLNKLPLEREKLENIDKFNEYIITGLRTKWGCNLNYIQSEFGNKEYLHCVDITKNLLQNSIIKLFNNWFSLSEEFLLQSDFYIEKFILEK